MQQEFSKIELEHLGKQSARVEKLFGLKHKPGFPNKVALSNWYIQTLIAQHFKCHYCDTSIIDIQHLIDIGLLRTRKTGYGVRGPILEIDKRINEDGYSPENCALSCYYCNNDKSYTLADEDYKTFFGSARSKYFKHLLESSD
jgi:hypothetical protein